MPLSHGALLQMVEQNDDKHEHGHRRLRDDWRALERRVLGLENAAVGTSLHLVKLENSRVDVTSLQFGTKTVIAVVTICLALAAGQWAVVVSVSSLQAQVSSQQNQITSLREEIMKQRAR